MEDNKHISKDFPFGSAIASTILENLPYQNWFVERFNAAVFENELKFASKGRKENLKAEEHQMNGIGLESHFSKLKFPLMKAIVDKLAALKLPIKLTETDTGRVSSAETKAFYLEQALREGFSHPAVDRIMLWTALHPYGFYQTCLTDYNLQNLLAGDVVEKLLKNGKTGR
ncbi:hypothetical protein OIU76_015534 [Salix suchowensis]|nr:hypothetical protein OIU76_015534 [Salix suchowensis]